MTSRIMEHCTLCPRNCGVDRTKSRGFCGETYKVRIARADLHLWEEPCLVGEKGAGTVFFSGCSLRCCFCQNYEISALGKGFEVTTGELGDIFLKLQDMGAANIDLVSPTHFVPQICTALDSIKDDLRIPVVYNCGGYENIQTLEMLRGRVSIFLPDLKYYSSELSQKYSSAADYFPVAINAIKEMVNIAGSPVFDSRGVMQRGVIVRHLVLPGQRHDSIKLMNELASNFDNKDILISLMSQYVPVYKAFEYKELSRRTSTFEYNSVVDRAVKLGFEGFFQQRSSADTDFIPKFYDNKNVL